MKLRPTILIALIVLLPLAALTWAVLRLAANEQIVLQQRYRDLMEERLRDINVNVNSVFATIERDFSRLTAIDDFQVEALRNINRTEPRLLQLFVLNPQGILNYPNPGGDLNSAERMFLIQAAKMFTGRDLKEAVARAEQQTTHEANNTEPTENQAPRDSSASTIYNSATTRNRSLPAFQKSSPQSQQTDSAGQDAILKSVQQIYSDKPINKLGAAEASSGWFVWYWDRGLNLIYWQRRPSGHIVGCALERARWMADLIAQLPETAAAHSDLDRHSSTLVRLVNSSAASVYQWGNFQPPDNVRPLCEVPLAAPLASWRLQCFAPSNRLTAGTGQGIYLSLLTGLLAIAIALGIAVWFFMREYARDMREATQQVSFVNQVSHELKTPLTNIRMYAELLDHDLQKIDKADTRKPQERLHVILSEGQRLTRLIGNVLAFASQKRKTLQLQPRPHQPCQLVQQIVDRFRPALAEKRIEVRVHCPDNTTVAIDADFVEQILGNLISNVEKYAAEGGLLEISCAVVDGWVTIDVKDAGPGIEQSKQAVVFEPFARACNDVSYAAGTGIGLSIARESARLHGGDLTLMNSQKGCWFRAMLKVQRQAQS